MFWGGFLTVKQKERPYSQWIGLRGNFTGKPYNGKIYGFRLRFSLKPIPLIFPSFINGTMDIVDSWIRNGDSPGMIRILRAGDVPLRKLLVYHILLSIYG